MPIVTGSHFRRSLWSVLAAGALSGPAVAIGVAQTDTSPPAANAVPLAEPAAIIPEESVTDATPDLMRLNADMSDRMTMPVEIGAAGPYPFLIDTGSHRSIISKELAARLALMALPPVEIISMAGRATVPSVHLDQLSFGTQVVNDLPALIIAHSDLGSAGLIGLDSLRDKRLTLDFRKRQMTIGKSSPSGLASHDRNTIVVQAKSKFGQLILVNSKLDGKRVNVILDTGADISVGNMALFNSLKQQKLVIPPRPVTLHAVTGQSVQAQFTVVRRLQIDFVNLENVPMVFLDAAPFAELDLADKPSMLLGMKMLRMFERVAIDFGARHVDFQLPQGFNDEETREKLRQFASR
ncbi:MAG: retroviral-like aspartic protease family protein [Sphingobium sp.]|nr:retroviral-like aspartic protease family protein [Sphingobium sp.]